MHFTALAFMSNIALLTIAGSICATSLVMLACSSLRLAGHLGLEVPPEAEVEGGEVGGSRRPFPSPQAPPAYHSVAKLVVEIPHVGISAVDWSTNRGILILINIESDIDPVVM